MKNLLKNKIVVITGGSSGIGAVLAEAVIHQGAKPLLISRSAEKLKQTADSILTKTNQEVTWYAADVSNKIEISKVFSDIYSNHQNIDILVNNAGFGLFRSTWETSEESFEAMMNVNYFGTVYCTKHVLEQMMNTRKGHIINVASLAGKIGTPKSSAYSASKHAVLGFTNSLRHEVRPFGIHVTAVNPGPVRTPFFDIADSEGSYVKKVDYMMLEASYVVNKIVQAMAKPKREINLPYWMDIGSRLYQMFPHLMDKIVGQQMNRK
jgi:short-subunit dehydrogenase